MSINNVRSIVWLLGFPAFTVGLTDQVYRLVEGNGAMLNVGQLLIATAVFICWLLLKPEESKNYLYLSKAEVVDSEEIYPGVIGDFDKEGNLVGIEVVIH